MANQNITALEQQTDGSFIEVVVSKRMSFTPTTANRWYRILQSDTAIAGEVRITASHPNRKTDIKLDIAVDPNSRGVIVQTGNLVMPPPGPGELGGHVSFVRVARNQSNQVIFDVLCTVAGEQINFEGFGNFIPDFNTTPTLIGNGGDEYNGITGNDGTSLANTLSLNKGLRTNLGVVSYHGHRDDPGQPLVIGGRAGYLHSLNLQGGSSKFTGATDHFHLFFQGGTASSAGFWTPQHFTAFGTFNDTNRHLWRTWQMQNANNTDANEIFLAGLPEVRFGSNPVTNVKYGVDTTRIESTGVGDPNQSPEGNTKPGPPLWEAQVDLFFDTAPNVSVNEFITLQFPVGDAGISAAVLVGTVLSVEGPIQAPDGAENKYKVIVKVAGLTKEEWPNPALARFSTSVQTAGSNGWILSKTSAPILPSNQVSLSAHSTRRDKMILSYDTPHNLQLGENIVFINNRIWETPPSVRSGYVSKVLSLSSVEIEVGVNRRTSNLRYGGLRFAHHGSSLPTNTVGTVLASPNHLIPANTYYRCRLSSSGVLPVGLEENKDYWFRTNPVNASAHWFNLFESLADAQAGTNAVQVDYRIPSYGIHYLTFMDLDPIGAAGWSLYRGNTDVVHQQTPADAGFTLHRSIFPNNRGLAQGVITQGSFGGLCNANTEYQPAFAYGFDVSVEADFTAAFGQKLINNTPKTTLVGYENTTLNFQQSSVVLNSPITQISGTEIQINSTNLTVSPAMLSSDGVDTFLKIQDNSGTVYGLKLQLI